MLKLPWLVKKRKNSKRVICGVAANIVDTVGGITTDKIKILINMEVLDDS